VYKKIKPLKNQGFLKSCQADLNRRPPPYQGDALPTEPWQHLLCVSQVEILSKKGIDVNPFSYTENNFWEL
jgi:hypothetical protein